MKSSNWIEIEYKECVAQVRMNGDNLVKVVTMMISINGASFGAIFTLSLQSDAYLLDAASLALSPILILANILLLKAAGLIEKNDDICHAKLSSIECFASREYLKGIEFRLSMFTAISEHRDKNKSRYDKVPGIAITLVWVLVLSWHLIKHFSAVLGE